MQNEVTVSGTSTHAHVPQAFMLPLQHSPPAVSALLNHSIRQ